MNTIILASGVALIAAQNQNAMLNAQTGTTNQTGNPMIQITGFSIGDRTVPVEQVESWDQYEDPLPVMQGNTVLNSPDDSYVYYTPDTLDRVKITCYVSEAIAQFPVGNVTIYATFNGVESALTYSAGTEQFIKLQTQQPGQSGANAAPGFEYYFDLMLEVPNLLERFDFSNLTLRVPEFAGYLNEQALPRALYDEHDDFFIQSQLLTGDPAVVFNSKNIHWGMQNMRSLTAVPINALEGKS